MLIIRRFNTNIINEIIKEINITYINNLGRWKIENDIHKVNIKIDQSNQDHCGCCIINEAKDNDEYYKPFFL